MHLSWPSSKSSSERSVGKASADRKDVILKLSCPHLRSWSIHVFICQLNDWACWKLCVNRTRCHGLHCSERFRCLLYNPVALPYVFPPAFSAPTTCLWAFAFVGSVVQVRPGCWESIDFSWGASSSGGAPRRLSMSRSLIDSLSMATQMHWLQSNHDDSGWSQLAGGRIPLGNSPSFISIKRYCWLWACSQFSFNYGSLEIKHLTCFRELLDVFENHSVFWWISMILWGVWFVA